MVKEVKLHQAIHIDEFVLAKIEDYRRLMIDSAYSEADAENYRIMSSESLLIEFISKYGYGMVEYFEKMTKYFQKK